LDEEFAVGDLVRELARDHDRIEVQDLPAARRSLSRSPIVQLARVQHDYVTGCRLDLADDAPRALRARGHDADAVLIVRMPWEGMLRKESDCCHAGHGGGVDHNLMDRFRHNCFVGVAG